MPRRAGRKRNTGDRRKNGRLIGDRKPDHGHPNVLAKRMKSLGRVDLSPDFPLSIMLARGLLAHDDGEAKRLHDAGMKFGALYARLFGKPFASAMDMGVEGLSSRRTPTATDRLHDRRSYDAAWRALRATGWRAHEAVMALAVFLDRPPWFAAAIDRRRVGIGWVVAVRSGLHALADLPPVRMTAEEIERAEREAMI